MMWHTRTQDRPASRQVNDYRRVRVPLKGGSQNNNGGGSGDGGGCGCGAVLLLAANSMRCESLSARAPCC